MPRSLLFFLCLVALAACFLSIKNADPRLDGATPPNEKKADDLAARLRAKAVEASSFIESKGYNNTLCFLIDMGIPSGQERFFVYHLKKDSVQYAGLVTHGRCNEFWLQGRKYSNTVGSGCTSLGKYRVGVSYTGRFGLAWKLHGLEAGNSNAFKRYVVLHSHGCVPEETVKEEICQSDGCPTISPGFLQTIKPMLEHSGKPVILWIFDSGEDQ